MGRRELDLGLNSNAQFSVRVDGSASVIHSPAARVRQGDMLGFFDGDLDGHREMATSPATPLRCCSFGLCFDCHAPIVDPEGLTGRDYGGPGVVRRGASLPPRNREASRGSKGTAILLWLRGAGSGS